MTTIEENCKSKGMEFVKGYYSKNGKYVYGYCREKSIDKFTYKDSKGRYISRDKWSKDWEDFHRHYKMVK